MIALRPSEKLAKALEIWAVTQQAHRARADEFHDFSLVPPGNPPRARRQTEDDRKDEPGRRRRRHAGSTGAEPRGIETFRQFSRTK